MGGNCCASTESSELRPPLEVKNEERTVLYYFDLYGRGEAIRMLLNHAKVQFKDTRLDNWEFESFKNSGKCEYGTLPVLEMNGKRYS